MKKKQEKKNKTKTAHNAYANTNETQLIQMNMELMFYSQGKHAWCLCEWFDIVVFTTLSIQTFHKF